MKPLSIDEREKPYLGREVIHEGKFRVYQIPKGIIRNPYTEEVISSLTFVSYRSK